jgi:hypothetical protein
VSSEIVQYDQLYRAIQQASAGSNRVWLASPYIGPNARWILSETITDAKDRRLLTNIHSGGIDRRELSLFATWAKHNVRTLEGLHAKIYIFDDEAYVTSANLTSRAVKSNFEIGARLRGATVIRLVAAFSRLYQQATPVSGRMISSVQVPTNRGEFSGRERHGRNHCNIVPWSLDIEEDNSSGAAPTFEAVEGLSDAMSSRINEKLVSQGLKSGYDYCNARDSESFVRRKYRLGHTFDVSESFGTKPTTWKIGAARSISSIKAVLKIGGVGGLVIVYRHLKNYTVTTKLREFAKRFHVFRGNPDKLELETYRRLVQRLSS